MQSVLADPAIETEAGTWRMGRVARAFDLRNSDERERAFARIATAISKYWLCKRSTSHVGEALECLGGNGYVEESILPRLYQEAPLYSIWEGSGNVICLDVLRSLTKVPHTLDALVQEMRLGRGRDSRLNAYMPRWKLLCTNTRGSRRKKIARNPRGKHARWRKNRHWPCKPHSSCAMDRPPWRRPFARLASREITVAPMERFRTKSIRRAY